MYVSRLSFHTLPGKTHEVEERLHQLAELVSQAGGIRPRVLRTHFASLGAADIVFEQEVSDLANLEQEVTQVTENSAFQHWTHGVSTLLAEPPKREIYLVVNSH